MAGNDGALSHYLWKPRARNGKTRILRLARRGLGSSRSLCAWRLEADYVQRQDAAGIVYAGFSQVSRWLEDCSRSYFCGGVTSASGSRIRDSIMFSAA